MKMLLIPFALLSACGTSKTSNAGVEVTLAERVESNALTKGEPGKEAVAHYCSEMSTITPESLGNVAPVRAQAVLAAQLAETARTKNISGWDSFETWLQNTAPSDRQPALDNLIQKYGLESACRSVSSVQKI